MTQGRERWQLPHKPLYHDGGCVEAARVRVQRGDGEGDGVGHIVVPRTMLNLKILYQAGIPTRHRI